MTVLVPPARRTPSVRGIKATQPVGAATWGDMARLHNWLKGQPRALIPGLATGPGPGFADTDDLKLGLRFYPSGYHHTRLWTVRATGSGNTDITIGSLSTRTMNPPAPPSGSGLSIPMLEPLEVVEELASLPTGMTAVDVDFRFEVGESDSWDLMDLSCWEIPHPYLRDADGQATSRIVSGQPITADLVSTLRSGAADMLIGHRMLGAWAVPYATGAGSTITTYAASTTSGTFGDLWDFPVPALARNTTQAPGATTEAVYCDVLAWVNSGTAEVRLKGTGGAGGTGSATSITATTPTWVTMEPLEVELEDLSETTGMPSNTFEVVDLQGRVTTATTLYVASAILYEATS